MFKEYTFVQPIGWQIEIWEVKWFSKATQPVKCGDLNSVLSGSKSFLFLSLLQTASLKIYSWFVVLLEVLQVMPSTKQCHPLSNAIQMPSGTFLPSKALSSQSHSSLLPSTYAYTIFLICSVPDKLSTFCLNSLH